MLASGITVGIRAMLTEVAIRAAKPKEKPYRLSDERGMYLEVAPRGSRYWRLAYRFEGRQKTLALGVYPDTSLKLAREKRDDARTLLASGKDPGAVRKAKRAARADTLDALSEEYFQQQARVLEEITLQAAKDRLAKWVLPSLGKRTLSSITAPDLLACLKRIELAGKNETAFRVKGIFSRIARYAIATHRAERDVSQDLKGALPPKTVKNRPAITDPAKVGALLRAIEGYPGQPSVAYALRLLPLVFVRPGELRGARWVEFDLDAEEPTWRIPAERMKMRDEHVVPLSAQAVFILREILALTGNGELVLPSLRTKLRPMSDATLTAALRRLGYSGDEQTAHGFRSIASTLLNEQGWHPDLIELQLAHAERNKVRSAYNKAKRLPERRKMMTAWADYLDGLKAAKGNVIAIGRARNAG
jgi:integrase